MLKSLSCSLVIGLSLPLVWALSCCGFRLVVDVVVVARPEGGGRLFDFSRCRVSVEYSDDAGCFARRRLVTRYSSKDDEK